MKTLIPIIVLFALSLSSCDFGVVGNGNVEVRDEKIKKFTRLEIDGNFDVYLTQSRTSSLRIEADENLQELIDVYQDGNRLKIVARENILRAKKKSLFISFSDLAKMDLNGAIDIRGKTPIDVSSLAVTCSGAIDMRMEFDTEKLRLDISGAANCDIEGQTEELIIELSGAGDFNAIDLRSEIVSIELSGAAHAKVFAADNLDVDISGVGSIRYKGDPEIRKSISGIGSLKKY
ncbi:MAG: head GIN domain-containing protein [Bacteroidota bacterium]|nr:head GIN domain-containing protein [Bacteroidota bacterium]